MEHFSGSWSKAALITDKNVSEVYQKQIVSFLSPHAKMVLPIVLEPGENSKTRSVKEKIEDAMLTSGFDRKSCVVSLGGGVICDIAGFVAATFLRGIDLIHIPTTLLAMVDASLGGKCGVNTPLGKNQIGAFWPPKQVVIETNFLNTLSREEVQNGMVEVIKAGLIRDYALFEAIEDGALPESCIEPARLVKQAVIEKDFFESGERRILNFGHTVGHALERLSNYTIPHGLGVWFGLLVETTLSYEKKLLDQTSYERIISLLIQDRFKYEIELPDKASLIASMDGDKKSLEGRPRFVLLEDIGKVASFDGEYCCYIEIKELERALNIVEEMLFEVHC